MTKFVISIIFFIVAGASFFLYVRPTYEDINSKKALIGNYKQALEKARQVQEKINELIAKRNEMSDEDLAKLDKLIPISVDNIQLILDIEGITKQYDMQMQKVNISRAVEQESRGNAEARINVGAQNQDTIKNLELSFDLVASYDEFIKFLRDLEHSLRIVDVVNLSLSASKERNFDSFESGLPADVDEQVEGQDKPANTFARKYTFSVVLRTYWVNNK